MICLMILFLASHSVAMTELPLEQCRIIQLAFLESSLVEIQTELGPDLVVGVQCVQPPQQPIG